MFEIISFFNYWLKRVDQHSLHSPFVFDFFTHVIAKPSRNDQDIEALRFKLTHSRKAIEITDFGAGSRVTRKRHRSIGSIAKYASTPSKFSRFLCSAIDYFGYANIIELGTSLGINTLYLSKRPDTKVHTFEGDPVVASIAKEHFEEFQRENIHLIIGNIDQTLPQRIEKLKTIDLAYLDANHRYDPTLSYYELIQPLTHAKSMIVVDDIHWSKEMNRAWNELRARPEVTLSIDLFEGGLLFFDPRLQKAHYVLKF